MAPGRASQDGTPNAFSEPRVAVMSASFATAATTKTAARKIRPASSAISVDPSLAFPADDDEAEPRLLAPVGLNPLL
jgi:hypothetical protein